MLLCFDSFQFHRNGKNRRALLSHVANDDGEVSKDFLSFVPDRQVMHNKQINMNSPGRYIL